MRRQTNSIILTSILLFSLLFFQVLNSDSIELTNIDINQRLISSEFSEQFIDTQIDNFFIEKIDRNQNKIADNLENRFGEVEVIIAFKDKISFDFGLQQLQSSFTLDETSFLVKTKIHTEQLEILSKIPGVAIIEQNLKLIPYLAYSTSQFGVRPFLWDQNIQGSPDHSIAIIDSGIDFSNDAFDGRIIASYNAIDNNLPATDNEGHGTHVAGIAAGSPTTSSTFTQTSRFTLPVASTNNPSPFWADILWANSNRTASVTVGMDWGDPGIDTPGGTAYTAIVKWDSTLNSGSGAFTLACPSCIEFDSTGEFEKTFTNIPAGDYYIGFGNDGGADNVFYEGWATIPQDTEIPSQLSVDGYPSHQGVAPKTNIVAVKVLDSTGGGDILTFANAISWVIANRFVYNITVVNLSLGLLDYSSIVDDKMKDLVEAGIIPVVAAGNSGAVSNGIFSPGSAEHAITVGAVNRFNEIAIYSSNGKSAAGVNVMKPDVVAPGGSPLVPFLGQDSSYPEGLGLIIAPDANNIGNDVISNDLAGQQGTSMSSPHVAGLAALLVQYIDQTEGWTWSEADVYRIKRAILAGTFEVRNIGSDGGEGTTDPLFPKQVPSINRNTKDFVEGWGAVNAKAAFEALSKNILVNKDIPLDFSLEDPFAPNVYSWKFSIKPNIEYQLDLQVPTGADLDVNIYNANIGEYGDLNVLYSTSSGKGIDEQLLIQENFLTEAIISVRLVDSDNRVDTAIISLNNPNFIPNINLESPSDGDYLNSTNIEILFTSVTDKAEAIVDDVSIGEIGSGYILNIVNEGIHNLTLIEKNVNTNEIDVVSSLFTLDLTIPILTSDLNNLNNAEFENPVLINYTTSDNFALDSIQLIVGSRIGPILTLEGTDSSGQIQLIPSHFENGPQKIKLILYDKAGNSMLHQIDVTLTHSIFIIPLEDLESEIEDPIKSIIWEASALNQDKYMIYVDDVVIDDNVWTSNNILFNIPILDIGIHIIRLEVFAVGGNFAIDEIILTIQDKLPPRVQSPESGNYDATFDHNLQFIIEEQFPQSIQISVDGAIIVNDPNWDGSLNIASVTIEGLPNENELVSIIVGDQNGNIASDNFTIFWEDLTDPRIVSPGDLDFEEKKAPEKITWTWQEKFQTEAKLLVDGETKIEINNANDQSITISNNFLNSLSTGRHDFVLIVNDQGGNLVQDEVIIFVLGDNSNSSTSPVNIFFMFVPLLLAVVFIKLRKK